jgi:2'-5' RNA ligase
MRLFFALDLPERVKERLAAFQERHEVLRASRTAPSQLHLTMAFLGEQPEEVLPLLRRIGAEVANERAAIPLRTATLGGFPRSREARVLWLGLEPNPRLGDLAAELRAALAAEGVALDRKPFTAHLTLARFRSPLDIASLGQAPEPVSFDARELVLYRSHLQAKGARYEPLGIFRLIQPSSGSH